MHGDKKYTSDETVIFIIMYSGIALVVGLVVGILLANSFMLVP